MHKLRQLNQQGVVSIVVSVIIMIILTLITIAFAQIMRREQRQALDRQLSSQAYYAAESAINDAAHALSQNSTLLNDSDKDCLDTSSGPLSQGVISSDLLIEYACVTISSTPSELKYDAIRVDETVQIELRPVNADGDANQLESIEISWSHIDGNGKATSTSTDLALLPQVSAWGDNPGIVRLEIVPVTGIFDKDNRQALLDARKVFWLYPADSSGVTSDINWQSNDTADGGLYKVNCKSTAPIQDDKCTTVITGLPRNPGNDTGMYYVLRVKAVYDDIKATINGQLVGGASGSAHFRGAQTEIDATGRAGDVLRRISTRVAVEQAYPIPEYGQQSFGGVCKRLEIVSALDVSYGCD